MLSPEYLAGLADSMVASFGEAEADITADIVRRVIKTGEVTNTAAWQIEKAKQAGLLQQDIKKAIAQAAGLSEKEVDQLLKEAGIKALAFDDAIYRMAGFVPLGLSESPALSAILFQGADATKRLLNNYTQTRAKTTEIAFRNLTDRAFLQVASGAMDSNTAIRRAVDELAKKDIETIAYPSGAVHVMDYSVRRAVITGINQAVAKLQLARAEELGCNLVQVTSHVGARPSHAVWQGGIYCIKGHHKHYGDFYRETGYGDGDGLCGWNCYHSFYPFFEGLSTSAFSRDPAADVGKDNDKEYELSQKQRKYERQIRATKRECVAYDAAVRAEKNEELKEAYKQDFQRASFKLKRQEAALDKFLSETGRTRLKEREQAPGFNRSVSGKAVWANRKAEQQNK